MSYAEIRDQNQAALRQAVLDAAIRVLVREGLASFSLRRVAREFGCSTTVLYTLFGNKQGLVEALWLEGFERLWRAEESTQETDPLRRLASLAQVYRRHALADPDYYRVMFGGAIADFQPSDAAVAVSRKPFRVLVDAVQACMAAGVFLPADPELVAAALWATVHGVISLQLAGNLSELEANAVFLSATRALASGYQAAPAPSRPQDEHAARTTKEDNHYV
jgi:AcrR family transcriptional regulator